MRRNPAPQPAAGQALSLPPVHPKEEALRLVEALRRHIARIEQAPPQLGRRPAQHLPWQFGLAEVDAHLPAHGLARSGLHDIAPAAYGETPAALGLALALSLRRLADPAERRPLLWCRLAREEREHGRLYGHGLEHMGLARSRFLTVTLKKPVSLLWTMEEALKSGALALVIGDCPPAQADLTVTRRLALAAQAGRAAGILVFAGHHAGATASHSRWTVGALPSRSPPFDARAPGTPLWRVELQRVRGGRPGAWMVEWQDAPHCFNLVSGIPGGALPARPPESRTPRAAQGPALRAG
jgi:protein ImuA